MEQPLDYLGDQYEILAKIREGGVGEIYRVRHRLLDEIRVVKVLRPHLADDRRHATRFAQEARAAIRLRHPNIVQIFDFSVADDGVGWMVMEFIRGIDLQQLVERRVRPSISPGARNGPSGTARPQLPSPQRVHSTVMSPPTI